MNVFQKMFGTHSEREVKRIMPLVEKIEKLRPTMIELSDEELRGKTAEYKKDWQKERLWMTCFLRHTLPFVNLHDAY